ARDAGTTGMKHGEDTRLCRRFRIALLPNPFGTRTLSNEGTRCWFVQKDVHFREPLRDLSEIRTTIRRTVWDRHPSIPAASTNFLLLVALVGRRGGPRCHGIAMPIEKLHRTAPDLRAQVRVAQGHLDRRVAHQILHRLEWDALHHQVRSEVCRNA